MTWADRFPTWSRRPALAGWAVITMLALFPTALAGPQQCQGEWHGTWEGNDGNTGTLRMTLERTETNALTGRISVVIDGYGEYVAPFTRVSCEGEKLEARYDNPDEMAGEIVIDGNIQANAVSGTFALAPQGGGEIFPGGTWQATRE